MSKFRQIFFRDYLVMWTRYYLTFHDLNMRPLATLLVTRDNSNSNMTPDQLVSPCPGQVMGLSTHYVTSLAAFQHVTIDSWNYDGSVGLSTYYVTSLQHVTVISHQNQWLNLVPGHSVDQVPRSNMSVGVAMKLQYYWHGTNDR